MDDERTIDELFAASVQGDYEDEEAWNAVGILRRRGNADVFELAKKHCESEDPKARARGLNVLGQLGARVPDTGRPFLEACVSEAISALIELMDDPSDDVRDWATFELGTQCDEDSDDIRVALRKRLSDSFADAKSEAIWGLARRTDPLGLRLLLERLEAQTWIQGDEYAAADTLGLSFDVSVDQLRSGLRGLMAEASRPARP